MKNGVECYKDFFGYFNALKTNCDCRSIPKKGQFPVFSRDLTPVFPFASAIVNQETQI